MVQKIKNFIRENNNIVLLVCDYYQTKQIPPKMTSLKNNLALFPVANVPLIDYIINSLISKSLTNIILCGNHLEKITEHVSQIFKKRINFTCISGEVNFGEILRSINDSCYDLKDFIVLYANHYTNFDINLLFEVHKQNQNLVTFFIHKNFSNSQVRYLYGTRDKCIVFFEKCINDKFNMKNIFNCIKKYKTVEFNFEGSSPNMAIISPGVVQNFVENFDFTSMCDFLESILAFNPFESKIGFYEASHNYLPSFTKIYSKEILTLYDYFKFNEDIIKSKIEDISQYIQNTNIVIFDGSYLLNLPKGLSFNKTENTILGCNNKLDKEFYIKNSAVGSRCKISGNLKSCIVWDDIDISEDLEEIIIFENNNKFNVHYLEEEFEIEEESFEKGNFFDDVVNYLDGIDLQTDFESIIRQVNLFKIVWNASNRDFIEAFAMFLVNYIDKNDIETSTINASIFFPLISECLFTVEDQEVLLSILYDLLLENDIEFRKEVFFRYGYLLIEDGIILKSVLKQYSKRIKKGTF